MKINHVIKVLVTSDFVLNAGFSVFGPVFAIYVTQQISDGSAQVVGFSAAIVQIFKSGLQIPVANYLDKNHGEYDDFYAMITGSFMIAIVPFMYLFAETAIHLYLIQAWFGIGAAIGLPPWYAIFTRHIDKLKENVEWSFDSVAIGVGGSIAAALSGVIVDRLGFDYVFIIGGLLALIGAAIQIRIYRDLLRFVGHDQVRATTDKQVT